MTDAAPSAPAPVQPTPGRIVLVRLGEGPSKGQTRPGMVIRVTPAAEEGHPMDPMKINVAVMVEGCDDFGHELGGAGVLFCKGLPYDQEGSIDGSWSWMAYQQGQAAKSDGDVAALRAELAAVKTALDGALQQIPPAPTGSNSG